MFELQPIVAHSKPEFYRELSEQSTHLLAGERNAIANAANFASLLYHAMEDVNWLGFYFYLGGELVVGPFQGKPACVRIAMGKGVCGTAAARRETVVVQDVNAFPGHIACDGASQSEIVIPLIQNGRLIGVLDIDSPIVSRFDQQDREGLEALATTFLNATDFPD